MEGGVEREQNGREMKKEGSHFLLLRYTLVSTYPKRSATGLLTLEYLRYALKAFRFSSTKTGSGYQKDLSQKSGP